MQRNGKFNGTLRYAVKQLVDTIKLFQKKSIAVAVGFFSLLCYNANLIKKYLFNDDIT